MSGLAGLLAGRRDPGVYRWHAAFAAEDVRHTVEHAGWSFGYVDGWTHQDKAGLLSELAGSLGFPEWFGHNLDALVDALRDLPEPTLVLWDGWGTLARSDPHAFGPALSILTDRSGDRPPFAVLLRGEGPDLQVPFLDAGDRESDSREPGDPEPGDPAHRPSG